MSKPVRKKPVGSGRKPDMFKIKSRWQDAIKKSLAKKKPAKGWPKA
jgi:hypothetical protein